MTDHLQVPVVFDAATRRADSSISLRFSTTVKISPEEFMEMDRAVQSVGYVLFSPNQFIESDVPRDEAPNDLRTQSERLRSCLYVLFKQEKEEGLVSTDFQPYYREKTEAILDWIKTKIKD